MKLRQKQEKKVKIRKKRKKKYEKNIRRHVLEDITAGPFQTPARIPLTRAKE